VLEGSRLSPRDEIDTDVIDARREEKDAENHEQPLVFEVDLLLFLLRRHLLLGVLVELDVVLQRLGRH